MDNAGILHILQAGKSCVPAAEANVGEEALATPAFTGDSIFIRGKDNLYCIGAKSP